MGTEQWPVAQVRIARPTDKLADVVEFYSGTLGLPVLFRNADVGYEVVGIGLPGVDYHLEFTSHVAGSPGEAPSGEHLLVLYFPDAPSRDEVSGRLEHAGHRPVELDNPWWAEHSALAFEDPDGWRVVLVPSAFA
ncbi:VOC family protein [Sciscionella marina]|uniref:VOC family protein n=1 Tax=Sciscionella marina TaxID=508770 RepID=UPI0004768C8D|nr:VOC family protein [Sciscionella marina]